MKIQFSENFSLSFTLTDNEKKELLKDFSNNFTQAHKLMSWIEDPNVKVTDRLEYFNHMFFIFESMDRLLKLLRDAGFTERQIIEALNELPF